jgi:chemotaxis protein methyltransferase CheR
METATRETGKAQKITPEEFVAVTALVRKESGIVLEQNKSYLVESRLQPLLNELGLFSFSDLLEKARRDPTRRILTRIIDAMSTNETYFFRDKAPFELLKFKILPDHYDRLEAAGKPKSIDIWSAASSTGQEVYSVAIVLKELFPDLNRWRVRILGTDISEAAVRQASLGRYNEVEMGRGLTPDKLERYFIKRDDGLWQVRDDLRALVQFRKMNLLAPWVGIGKYDIILCRNVAIYFSREDRQRLFDQIADHLNPGGALMIGSTESLLGISKRFERLQYHNSVFYRVKS